MLGVLHVKLLDPVTFTNVRVGGATFIMLKAVVVEHPPAAVTVTFVVPLFRLFAMVCVLEVIDAGVGFQFTV